MNEMHPGVPIFAFLDWGGGKDRPLDVFSQQLSANDQDTFLKVADEFFTRKGVKFIYPCMAEIWGNRQKKLMAHTTRTIRLPLNLILMAQ